MGEQMDRQTNKQTNKQNDGPEIRCTDRQVGRKTDGGQTDRHTSTIEWADR